MNPFLYIKVAVILALVAVSYWCYHLIGVNAATELKLKEANAVIELVQQAKEKSDKMQLELTAQLNVLRSQTQEVVTKIIRVPVASNETCMSDVLKSVLGAQK